jgi:hypothetical protein
LFPRVGIDATEFTNPAGTGRMHVYRGVNDPVTNGDVQGGGAGDCSAANAGNCPLWSTKSALERYDIVILSCEGQEYNETKPNKVPMHDWINEGGKVFATHYHYTWFVNGPPDFQGVANWSPNGRNFSAPFDIDTTFPKGQAFAKWLQYVGAATNTIALIGTWNDLSTVNAGAQRWVYTPQNGATPEADRYITFNTPIGGTPPSPDAGPDAGPSYCGKAVYSDIHVGNGEYAATVPTTCSSNPLTPQEKALEFLFFDLSACVQNDSLPVGPPPVVH